MKHTILIVDDEPANLRALERLFRDDYEVKTASSGKEALDLLASLEPALILSDQRMPGMTGIEFLMRAAELLPQTIRIILTGYTDVRDLVEAINSGVVYRYITKPWVNTDLLQAVSGGVALYEAKQGQQSLVEANQRLTGRLQIAVQSFIKSVRETIAQKNHALGEHCRRTSYYASLIGERLKLNTVELERLNVAALLHEAPALRIPFDLDMKRSALTTEQFRVTRNSYENGLRMISSVPDMQDIANIIAYQHEHFDGNGLFLSLEGDKIPFLSRILAVASAFDEIVSPRIAIIGRMSGSATDILLTRSGGKLDPAIVDTCLRMHLAELAATHSAGASAPKVRPAPTFATSTISAAAI